MIMETNAGHGGIKEKFNGLPGFRFHPTEQELVGFYLKRMVQGKLHNFNFIPMLELYRHEPWDLPNFASLGEREMFFFVPRDERCQNSRGRPNRLTATGYWKATGSDRSVHDDKSQCIGLKKTLVFYRGRARRGQKTDWLMNEYRLPDYFDKRKKEVVLCRIYRKAAPLKWLEQQAMSCQEEVDSSHSKSQHSLIFPADFNDTKSIQDAKSICVRDSDSLACHEITTEPSSSPKDNVTKSDITGSLGCAVDSGFVDSTIDGEFIDWDFQVSAEDYTRFTEFSSIITKLNFDV